MSNFQCDNCDHTFYVPGQNLPTMITSGCPECGGNARPEPDQPSPQHGDFAARDMVGPTQDDMGGNPLQEGILGQTDGGWSPARNRDESYASVQGASDPGMDPKCPKCGSPMYFRSGVSLGRMWPEGAWECSNQRCWHMLPPGDLAPSTYPDPDQSHSDLTIPEGWDGASSTASARTQWMTPMRNHPAASNQTPQMPWQIEEVAEPGMDNEDAEEKINGEKHAGIGSLVSLGLGAAFPEIGIPAKLLAGGAASLMGSAMGGGGGGQRAPQSDPSLAMEASLPGGGTPGDPRVETEDPEKVDPGEQDGDWQDGMNSEEAGGADGPHNDFQDQMSPGLESLHMLLPLIVHYAESEDSGSDHPLVKALHELLHSEGALDGPEDPEAAAEVIRLVKGQDGDPGPESHPDPAGHEDHKESANHQGPHSPEQIAAVQQFLMQQGREQEVPNVPLQPWMYANEMAEIANVDLPPQDVSQQPPMPAQEEAPPEDTMPMPGMKAPPPGQQGLTGRVAMPIDENGREYINLEPNWEGMRNWVLSIARTDMAKAIEVNQSLGHEGVPEEELHAIGQHRIPEIPTAQMGWDDPRNSKTAEHGDVGNSANPVGVPAADQLGQPDLEGQQDSSGQWQTDGGDPLVVGQQYELHTPGVDIPDIVNVKAVKPDAVELEFTGAYELGFAKEITRQEFQIMGYTFSPVQGGDAQLDSPVEQQAPDAQAPPPFAPHDEQIHSSWKTIAFMPGAPDGTQPGGVCAKCQGPLQPDGSCAGCERGAGAPGAPGVPPAPATLQAAQGGQPQSPYLLPGGASATPPPYSRSAGAHFTPNEQRELIDEEGTARNADQMDLEFTHYQSRTASYATDESFLFGA